MHSIAIQVPKTDVTWGGKPPTDASSSKSVVGIWTTASRRQARVLDGMGGSSQSGPYVQVSRLGNPLFNEVIVPMAEKDLWNATPPTADKDFAKYVAKPELAGLLPVLFPGVFPHLDALNQSGKPRADLLAILLTGIPSGLIPGFQNFTGSTQADLLRLNMAIPPSSSPSIMGLLGGDARRLPQRPAAGGRHRGDRAAGRRGRGLPADRPVVHRGRGRAGGRRRRHAGRPDRQVPEHLPLPRRPAQRLLRRDQVVLAHGHPHPHPHAHGDGGGGATEPAHEHPHPHPHPPEAAHVVARAAVLDIGADVGAVLVHTEADLDGEEIELYDEAGAYLMHTEVHGRDLAGQRRYAGLFPAVPAGSYLLDRCDGSPRERLVVTGGEVTVVARVPVAAGAGG